MGFLSSVFALFGKPDRSAGAPPDLTSESLRVTPSRCPYWSADATYALDCVGESFYDESIRVVAANTSGNPALVFCTAQLIPDNNNQYDAQAVAVFIEERKVAHLSREDARRLRNALLETGIGEVPTSCDAVITEGGISDDGQRFSYSIQLDVDLQSKPDPTVLPRHQSIERKEWGPIVVSKTDGEVLIQSPLLDRTTANLCMVNGALQEWRPPAGNDIYLYTRGSVGGSGRVLVVPASVIPEWDDFPYVTVYSIRGRTAVVRIGKEPDARFSFLERPTARVLVLSADVASNSVADLQVAGKLVEVDMAAGTMLGELGELSVSTEPDALNPQYRGALHAMVMGADLLVGINVPICQRAIGQAVPGLSTLWCSAETLDEEDIKAAPLASQPAKIVAKLFTHTGKTKRSQTHMTRLLRNLQKGFVPAHVVGY